MAALSKIQVPILWASLYEGTGGDFDFDKTPSVMTSLRRILTTPERDNKVKLTPGVGAPYSLGEKVIGGALGIGIDRKVLENYQYLASNARPDDSYIAGGGSRGADAARRELGVINCVGLPEDPKDCKVLYEMFLDNKLKDREVCAGLIKKYKCQKIKIIALLTIDTVCVYNIPRTGYLSAVPRLRKEHDSSPIIAPKGSYLKLHAVALGDNRKPFLPFMMHNPPDAEQQDRPTNMYFSGAHSDLMAGALSMFVLGWFVGHLDALGEVSINHEELMKIFPDYGGASNIAWEACCRAEAHQSYKGVYLATGYCTRVPGELHNRDFTVNEQIHPSVHARNYGITMRDDAIAKHHYSPEHPDGPAWVRNDAATAGPGDEMEGHIRKMEAQLRGLEAALWGFPW